MNFLAPYRDARHQKTQLLFPLKRAASITKTAVVCPDVFRSQFFLFIKQDRKLFSVKMLENTSSAMQLSCAAQLRSSDQLSYAAQLGSAQFNNATQLG